MKPPPPDLLPVERVDPNALRPACSLINALESTRSPRKAGRLPASFERSAGFTLVEVLIAMTLSLMVISAVLSTYVFLGRNFTRSLGINSANQPNLESQARRTLAYFAQDVRMASGVDTTGVLPLVLPSAAGVTLDLPGSSGNTTVTYVYDSTARTLTRTPTGGPSQVLHSGLLSCNIGYYDSSDNPYTTFASFLAGIKQLSLTFTSQAGSSANGTLTPIFQTASPRLLIRNKALLP